jgi:predicted N-acyltransferase
MADGSPTIRIRLAGAIDDIAPAEWDRCAGPDNPFLAHAFLKALEDSRSVGADAGWLPQHMIAEDGAGAILGVAPMYLKSHSYGEYVFDHGWADAYRRAGGRYYPKLQIAVPFTPVPGPRLLTAPGADPVVAQSLAAGAVQVAERLGVSSLHVTFADRAQAEMMGELGFLSRIGYQFHWNNPGYADFDDFLGALSSRKRKAIRKERREASESGIVVHALTGDTLEARHWDAFYEFYLSTSDRKWGNPYLTRGFFTELGRAMTDRVVLMMAEDRGRFVAGALNLMGRDVLYGRNWGCAGDYPFLHFETCYYRALDFAIERKLARVEAGAQGEHKLQRGYLPARTYSAHWFRDGGMRRAIGDYLERETAYVEAEIEALMAHSPFRQDGDASNGG